MPIQTGPQPFNQWQSFQNQRQREYVYAPVSPIFFNNYHPYNNSTSKNLNSNYWLNSRSNYYNQINNANSYNYAVNPNFKQQSYYPFFQYSNPPHANYQGINYMYQPIKYY